ncbi:hypothetical protein SODALDRAFT_357355 [Sodiomyces alkalinus F11]|uniref:Uncharacterized protein n=1 Tax=Sodiomyces alkalinus (strain CBS 110278 / VKM F-3762 / F11) TaxID=1314773 RepID=A0A3N2Q3S1_SODAK|nr:hypothetical protein SODALDRAFT_357355 [Sodiomyces alkalinus F11]ROT41318.1 hypothetical protein SODALDRAFT_357355 [Sodiomyces alkalinus F11]
MPRLSSVLFVLAGLLASGSAVPPSSSNLNSSSIVDVHWLGTKPSYHGGTAFGIPWPRGKHHPNTTNSAISGSESDDGEEIALQPWSPRSPRVGVSESADEIRVNTGKIVVTFPKTGNVIIRSIRTAGGKTATSKTEVNPPSSTSTFESNIEKVSVGEDNDVRTLVTVRGKHMVVGEGEHAPWLPFVLRFYLYAESEAIGLVHNIVFDADARKDFIAGLGIRDTNTWDERVTSRLHWIPPWDDFSLSQLSPDGFTLRKRTKAGQSWVKSPGATRAGGLAYLGGATVGGLAIGLRNFWQRYPTGLDVKSAAATRHGIQHYSDSAKQARISNAQYLKQFFYLSGGDERVGELLEDPEAVDVGLGTDYSSLASSWLIEWERRGPIWEEAFAKLNDTATGIAKLRNGFVSGSALYNPQEGTLHKPYTDAENEGVVSVSHLSAMFGFAGGGVWESVRLKGSEVLAPIDEASWISTNEFAQYGCVKKVPCR